MKINSLGLNHNKKIVLLLFFTIFDALFLFSLNVLDVRADNPLNYTWTCIRHGYRDTKFCNGPGLYIDGGETNYQLSYDLYGHRHGTSAMDVQVCWMGMSGGMQCNTWSGTGGNLGPELGGTHTNIGLWGGSFTGNDSAGYYITFWTFVEDAESQLYLNGSGWTPPPPPPENCNDPLASNYGDPLPCEYTGFPQSGCYPADQTIPEGGTAYFLAGGGDGSYSWQADDGSPSSGTGSTFSSTFALEDDETVRVTSAGQTSECYVHIRAGAPTGGGGGGGGYTSPYSSPYTTPICGDYQVQGSESCDLGANNGTCAEGKDCSDSCTRNVCGSCELPTSPYYCSGSTNASYFCDGNANGISDLDEFARRLENGTCYGGAYGARVSTACIFPWSTPSVTNIGNWRGRGDQGGECGNSACNNNDNTVNGVPPGGVVGTVCVTRDDDQALGWQQESCNRRFSCDIDNFAGPPSVDIKCDNSDACTLPPVNTGVNLGWSGVNITSCLASGDWAGSKAVSGTQATGSFTPGVYSYTLNCDGPLGQVTDTVNVYVAVPVAVDIKCNAGDSCTVGYGGAIDLTWTSTGLNTGDTCTASGDWTGTYPQQSSGPTNLSNITSTRTYTLTCTRASDSAYNFDTVVVFVDVPPPTIPPYNGDPYSGVRVTTSNATYCSVGPHAIVGWTYNDSIGLNQGAYQVTIDNDGNPDDGGEEYESGPVASVIANGQSQTVSVSGCGSGNPVTSPQAACRMTWNTAYQAWVKVMNSAGVWSAWTLMSSFNGVAANNWTTPRHRFPRPTFSFTPSNPAIGEVVAFTEGPGTFDATATNRSWLWNFGDGSFQSILPPTANANTTHTYTAAGNYQVMLSATDDVGTCTSFPIPVLTQRTLPEWREVLPR